MKRRGGFTLIELLVVIAIIGILAAMLFPVFARARESARKTQCLANIKNIAIAINMYLTDYEACPPGNTDKNLTAWVDSLALADGGGNHRCSGQGGIVEWGWRANPYLRWPVILDEYVKNRAVWECPSALIESGAAFIVPMGPNGDFQQYLAANTDVWGQDAMGYGYGICSMSYPSGWGGEVTDSIAQGQLAGRNLLAGGGSVAKQSFVQSVSFNDRAIGVNVSSIEDTAKYEICADGGSMVDAGAPAMIAYPDTCCAECSGIVYFKWDWPDPNGCPDGSYCADCANMHMNLNFARDINLRKSHTRHLGGSNLGFLDGHAKWMTAEAILAAYSDGSLQGVTAQCDGSSPDDYRINCGEEPPAGMIFLYSKNPNR